MLRLNITGNTSYKMTLSMIITFALLFVFMNVILTNLKAGFGGDRYNYSLNFYGVRQAETPGLGFIIDLVHYFSSNVHSLFHISGFLSLILIFFAYRISEDAEPEALLFLLLTQTVFSCFVNMKQCYANGFAALAIVLALKNKNILSIACIFLAISFHMCGYFLIPVFIMLKMKKNRTAVIIFFVIILIALIFLKPLLLQIAVLADQFVPKLSSKIYFYFDETTTAEYSSGLVKGIPYYIVTLTGWLKRKKLKSKIHNYDNYFLLSALISLAYIATAYDYWIYRLAYMLYLPDGIFFAKIMRYENNIHERRRLNFSVMWLSALLLVRHIVASHINFGGI